MNGDEFLRRIKKLGKDRGIAVQFDKRHGKGSHGTLYYGDRKTTLKDRRKEIGPACYRQCCSSSASTNGT